MDKNDRELVALLDSSSSKRHDLLTWIVSNFEKLHQEPENVDIATHILDSLNEFIRYLCNTQDQAELESHFISIRVSQLYSGCLLRIEDKFSGKIFDSAEFLANVLLEEDITFILNENDAPPKKKKSTGKKTYVYSPPKGLACTILTQLFETFGKTIASLAPLIFNTIFKNLKKILEKSKHLHATYMTCLLQLFNTILRNCQDLVLDSTYLTKFTKLSKSVFEDIYSEKRDFPVNFVSTIIEIWSVLFTRVNFIKDHQTVDISSTLYRKFIISEIGICGFSNDETRLYTAKSLAEILFNYHFINNLMTLDEIWKFYIKVFTHSKTRDIKSGCFESIIHFISLSIAYQNNLLDSTNYLDIVRALAKEISAHEDMAYATMDTIGRYMRFFQYMHELILPYLGESAKNDILLTTMGISRSAVDTENSDSVSVKIENQWMTLVQLDLVHIILEDVSSSFGVDDRKEEQMMSRLIDLSTCDVFNIRIHAVRTLKTFIQSFPQYLSGTIEGSLAALTNNFKLTKEFPFANSHGHGLIIASLIDIADKMYVSYELIMKITAFTTSFIKNHTTSTSGHLYHNGIICWILLSGLMNYGDSQHLHMMTPQLFLFWKVLLTHSFTYHGEDELYKNLEIRNHALTCLLTYLKHTSLSKNDAKQVSYLLTKCSNFNNSVTLKSTKIDNALLVNENRILQIYLKIQEHIKNDFNSSLLILIVKNFSNPNLYTEAKHLALSTLKGSTLTNKEGTGEDTVIVSNVDTLLRLNDGFAYGLSSKVNTKGISLLTTQNKRHEIHSVSGSWPSNEYYWYRKYEDEVLTPISSILSFDYLFMLYGHHSYSASHRFSPKVTTSLVDSSTEIFSLVFPYLNSRIQYSVIESLNLSMFSKMTNQLRRVAIAANVCVALYDSLNIIQRNKLHLQSDVGQLIMESIKKIEFYNDTYLTKLKAECIGLTIAAIGRSLEKDEARNLLNEQVNVLIKNVVDVNEPHFRVFHALSLASTFKYSPRVASFERIFDVLHSLVKDPHPVVHSWSLMAMNALLEKHPMLDIKTNTILVQTLENTMVDPSFGLFGASILNYNYNKEYNSHIAVGKVLYTLTETVGPSFQELDSYTLDCFKNMVIGLLTSNDAISQSKSCSIYENIATFKINDLLSSKLFLQTIKNRSISSVLNGFGSCYYNSNFTRSSEIFSQNTSTRATLEQFQLLGQLLRLQRNETAVIDAGHAVWLYLSLYPASTALADYLYQRNAYSLKNDNYWFDKLYSVFGVRQEELLQKYYSICSESFNTKGLTREETNEIKGEDEEAINASHTKKNNEHSTLEQKSDNIPWRARLLILQLILQICSQSKQDGKQHTILSKRLPELIKISFQAATTRITEVKSLGLKILSFILEQFAQMRDPDFPDSSILEQQEAQITSALMPTFESDNSPDIITAAIDVAAQFLSSEVASVDRLNRIANLLLSLLSSFDNKAILPLVGGNLVATQKARRQIELTVLKAWAEIVLKALLQNNQDLIDYTRTYWDTLIPLWIISLREYVILKYEDVKNGEPKENADHKLAEENKMTKLELYKPVWLTFVETLGCLLEKDQVLILNCLNDEEVGSFMFILFSQCLEAITLHIDDYSVKLKVLPALHNILSCSIPPESLFEDDIHSEVVDILDRLIINASSEEKLLITDIINDLITSYTKQYSVQDEFLQGIDKLYELLRLLLVIISDLLPFIKLDYVPDASSETLLLSSNDSKVLKHCFLVLGSNISQFDNMFKLDLYACLLFILGRIYEYDSRNELIPFSLPLLKSIVKELSDKEGANNNLMDIFYSTIKNIVFDKLTKENKIATMLVFITNGYCGISKVELKLTISELVGLLDDEEVQPICVQGIKSIIGNSTNFTICNMATKEVIGAFLSKFNEDIPVAELHLMFDVLLLFIQKTCDKKSGKEAAAFALYLSFELQYYNLAHTNKESIAPRVLEAAAIDKQSFKTAVTTLLNDEQRQLIEKLMADYSHESEAHHANVKAVELKNFD